MAFNKPGFDFRPKKIKSRKKSQNPEQRSEKIKKQVAALISMLHS